jgi:hypothetical protein
LRCGDSTHDTDQSSAASGREAPGAAATVLRLAGHGDAAVRADCGAGLLDHCRLHLGQDARNDFLKKEIAVLDKEIDQIKRLKEQSDALTERKRIIESLQRDRAEAVRLLSELAKQMPEGVYLRSLKQEGQRISLAGYAQSVGTGIDADAQYRSLAVARKTAVAGNQGGHGGQAASQ